MKNAVTEATEAYEILGTVITRIGIDMVHLKASGRGILRGIKANTAALAGMGIAQKNAFSFERKGLTGLQVLAGFATHQAA